MFPSLKFQYSVTLFSFVFCFCLGSKLGFLPKELMNKQASMTGGLVGQSEHLIFPSVPPLVTMILTLLSLMVRNLLLTSKIIILQDYWVRGRGHSKFHTRRLPPKGPNLYPRLSRKACRLLSSPAVLRKFTKIFLACERQTFVLVHRR